MKFAIAVIFFNPDVHVFQRMERYSEWFEKCLVVDNTPDDDHCKVYLNSRIEYKWMEGNKGLSVALEYAFRWAYENEVQYLLTMDQDTEYPDTEIEKMMVYIQTNPGAAIYCTNWRKIYWNREMTQKKMGPLAIDPKETKEVEASMTSGSWMDVKKAVEILPLENYFIGYVDTDISFQLRCKGLKIICVGDSVINQQIGGKVIGGRLNMLFRKILHTKERYYYMSRNNLYLAEKYAGYKKIRNILWKNRVRILFNLLFFEDGRVEKYKYWTMGKCAFRKREMGAIDQRYSCEQKPF